MTTQGSGPTGDVVVQKYGGSSLATVSQVRQVADRVGALARSGRRVVVVVSAQGDATDELVGRADAVNPHPAGHELDQLLATGETASAALMAMALQRGGLAATALSGSRSGVLATGPHGAGVVVAIDTDQLRTLLDAGRTVVIAGFQGVTADGDIITLGRGGSDTTAVAVAAELRSGHCEIYSDVPGVFTADPRVVTDARLRPDIDIGVMTEMAFAGARVMHSRAVELAALYDVDILVGRSTATRTGTRIHRRDGTDMHRLNDGRRTEAATPLPHSPRVAREQLHDGHLGALVVAQPPSSRFSARIGAVILPVTGSVTRHTAASYGTSRRSWVDAGALLRTVHAFGMFSGHDGREPDHRNRRVVAPSARSGHDEEADETSERTTTRRDRTANSPHRRHPTKAATLGRRIFGRRPGAALHPLRPNVGEDPLTEPVPSVPDPCPGPGAGGRHVLRGHRRAAPELLAAVDRFRALRRDVRRRDEGEAAAERREAGPDRLEGPDAVGGGGAGCRRRGSTSLRRRGHQEDRREGLGALRESAQFVEDERLGLVHGQPRGVDLPWGRCRSLYVHQPTLTALATNGH
ncbi:hypothetical protein [Streptomyces sp. WAC00303]|uniref:amino acid kinase family protein n=1 Tax=Streptomyces sp. WAC00303 TaxID=2933779 RepID=UPI0020575C3B|nr:hypothetical protein [Streptomyces sp. WAC00303]UPT42582.1 hypothetical protein MWG59_14845 [Streptomyces sp. WAC00303]